MKVSEFECVVETRSNSRTAHAAAALSGEVRAVPSELTLTRKITKDAENMVYLWQKFKTTA